MSTTIPCVPIDCDFPPDLLLYSLDGLYYFLNNDLRFVLTCPPGYECTNFPIIWRTKRGTITPVYVPTIRPVTQVIPLSIPCCNYQIVSATVYTVVNPTGPNLFSGYASTVPDPSNYSGPLPPVYFNNVSQTQVQTKIQLFITQVIGNMMIQAAALEAICNLSDPDSPTGPTIFPPNDPRNPNPPPGPPGHPYIPMRLGELVNPNACLNQVYSELISVYGGRQPITFNILAGTLPPGLNLTDYCVPACAAQISGTPTTINNYTFTLQAKDALSRYAQRDYTISIIGISNATTLADATPLLPYSDTLVGSGGTGPYTFSWDPVVNPSWIDDITSAGVITSSTGPPLSGACSTWILEVTVTDANGISCTQNPEIFETADFTNVPVTGTQCTAYSFQMETAPDKSGMTFSGTMPDGLSISAAGLITGTPSSPGLQTAVITATSTTDPLCTVTKSFDIDIASQSLNYATNPKDCVWVHPGGGGIPPATGSFTTLGDGAHLKISIECTAVGQDGQISRDTRLGWCASLPGVPNMRARADWTVTGSGNTAGQVVVVIGQVTVANYSTNPIASGTSGWVTITNPPWPQVPAADNDSYFIVEARSSGGYNVGKIEVTITIEFF